MSIYGITRLLSSRELGPAQILPTLEAFGAEVETRCEQLEAILTELADLTAGDEHLEQARALLEPEARRVEQEVIATFTVERKLGARERLELEQEAPRIGGRLQAVRELIDVIGHAAAPKPTPLRATDFLTGPWRPRLTFVERRVDVMASCNGPVFEAEPAIVRMMLQVALRQVDVQQPFLSVQGDPPSIRIGNGEDEEVQTIERSTVPIGPALAVESEILEAVGRSAGTRLRLAGDGAQIDQVA